ncbi:MAG: hypothetical protein AB1393_14170 [Candidatus Edwardsbacteria bacterium]
MKIAKNEHLGEILLVFTEAELHSCLETKGIDKNKIDYETLLTEVKNYLKELADSCEWFQSIEDAVDNFMAKQNEERS